MERTAERLAERARALRAEGLSLGAIARQLKVSKSSVHRWTAGEQLPDDELDGQADDELTSARRQLELDRIAAARRRLSSGADGGGDGLLMRYLERVERRLDDVTNQLRAQPAAPPAPSIFDQLKSVRELAEGMRPFFPASPSTSAEDLQYRVAMEKLNGEQRLKLRELDVRFEEVRAFIQRNEWQARFVEGQLPAILQWVMARGWKEDEPASPPKPALEVVNGQETQGPCPACGKLIGIPAGVTDDVCPSCSAQLRVVDGRIELGTSARVREDRGGFAS